MKKIFLIGTLAITVGCGKKQTPAPSVSSAIITTFAGNGSFGYSGDGGAATAAELNNPANVATDNSGNVFIVDANNRLIRKVNAIGIISTIAGATSYTPGGGNGDGGPATNTIVLPLGVAVDNAGNVYITDQNYVSIRKINSSGIIYTIAGGSGNQGYTGDGGPATAAEIVAYDLAADNNGNLYFSDGSSVVRRISASGIITTIAGNGQKGYSADGNAATASQLTEPYGIAVDNSGSVYISEKGNQRVRMVNTSGILHTIAGGGTAGLGDGHAATTAELLSPMGVAVDNSGNVLIADLGNNRVRKVSK